MVAIATKQDAETPADSDFQQYSRKVLTDIASALGLPYETLRGRNRDGELQRTRLAVHARCIDPIKEPGE